MRKQLVVMLVSIGGCEPLVPANPLATGWVAPLVDPLDDDALIIPVTVDGARWHLFVLDPGRDRTIVDADLLDTGRDGEITVAIGSQSYDLAVNGVAPRSLDRGGHEISGVLGADVLANQAAFGIDRDSGIAWQTATYTPPTGVLHLGYSDGTVEAQIGDQPRFVRLDLEHATDQVVATDWPVDRHTTVVTDHRFVPAFVTSIAVGAMQRDAELVTAYEPAWGEIRTGALGTAFFAPYDIALDGTRNELYYRARSPQTPVSRIARWGPRPCPDLGCATVEITGDMISVHRDAMAAIVDLEIVIELTRRDDTRRIAASFPAGHDNTITMHDPSFVDATADIVDMSPFPRACEGDAGCLRVRPSCDWRGWIAWTTVGDCRR